MPVATGAPVSSATCCGSRSASPTGRWRVVLWVVESSRREFRELLAALPSW